MVETSLEGISTGISPIAMTTRSGSITPPADAAELWENANKALKELLATKASTDACRQRAIWELGMELCCNESQATESIKEARAVCSQVTLDAKALCFTTIKEVKTVCSCVNLDAKALCLAMVKEDKMIWACTIQEAKAACSTAIRDAEIWRASQADSHQREQWQNHVALGDASHLRGGQKSSQLPLCLSSHSVHQPSSSSKACWWLPTIFYWGRHLHLTHLPYHKGPP